MNFMRSKAGFTLVELIVVIAILAILAGVAIPAYSGYITKANNAADMQVLSSVNTAAQGLAAAESATVTKITVSATGTIDVTCNPSSVDIDSDVTTLAALGSNAFSSKFGGAEWTSTTEKWTITNN